MATRQEIREIQQSLKNLGFDPGPIDGIVGPRTRSAAQNYVNSLSGTAAKGAYEYYNNVLGGLTSKKLLLQKKNQKKINLFYMTKMETLMNMMFFHKHK
jgi:peptidoglycan hydrolase-like protein with peptidoglycan-binding domain